MSKWALAASCVLVGCYAPSAKPGARCTLDGLCPTGLDCIDGFCVVAGSGAPDAAITDPDAARSDAAPVDGAPAFAVRINVGGVAHTGIDYPGEWSADVGVGGICAGMEFASPTAEINGTNDSPLFFDQMFAPALSCMIPNVPSGRYRVTLLFAELRLGGAPCTGPSNLTRIFDIALEGVTVATAFDMTAASGGCAATGGPGHAVDRSFDVDVLDGALDLTETASAGAAAVNAIEIVAL